MSRKELFLSEALEIKRHLVQFLKHPMQEIKHIPDWPWGRLLALQISMAAVTGALAGLAERKTTFAIIAGLFLSPILTLITLGISTLFFYYCFQIFAGKTVAARSLFTVILFASIPQYIFQIISGYVPPITYVGMAFAAYLLWVGFIENFQLDRKLMLRLIVALYAILFILTAWNQIRSSPRWEKVMGSPDSYEAPEVELGK
jgi:hypothetical protein